VHNIIGRRRKHCDPVTATRKRERHLLAASVSVDRGWPEEHDMRRGTIDWGGGSPQAQSSLPVY
jgi:hypothetical protein